VPRIGQVGTLWVGMAFVVAGGLTLLLGVREPRGGSRLVAREEEALAALWHSISLLWRKPRTAIACLIRIINTAPEFGFLVFLPTFFIHTIGFSLVVWLHLLSAIFLSNLVWNLLFGLISDRIGWIRTIVIFGGFGCALSTLAIYYVPVWRHSLVVSAIAGACYGATLAAYVPLSALMTSLAPEEKGASLALLSLGAGASVFVGPALVALFLRPLGIRGVIWIFASLYLANVLLALQLKFNPVPQDDMALAGVSR